MFRKNGIRSARKSESAWPLVPTQPQRAQKGIPDELLWNGNPLHSTSGQGLCWRISHLEHLVMRGLFSFTPKSEASVKEGNFD